MQKSILITGCSSGIGKATALFLRDKGYRVFATARKPEDVLALKQVGFESFLLDVRQPEQILSVINTIKTLTGGHLYALCNNAGYAQPGALEDIDRKNLRDQFETNVFGLHDLTRLTLPIFREQGYGRIIHLGSILGIISLPFRGAYNASKYAVEGLADTLRLELRDTQIYVSIIEPGPIETAFRDNALSAYQGHIEPSTSAYRETYKRFLSNFMRDKNQLSFSEHPEAVAKIIYHALESSHPKPHYLVTKPAYLLSFLKRVLPTRWLDFLLSSIAKHETK